MSTLCAGRRLFISLLCNRSYFQSMIVSGRHLFKSNISSKTQRKIPLYQMSLVSVVSGVILGGGITFYTFRRNQSLLLNKDTVIPFLENLPNVNISRTVYYEADNSGLQLTLFQYPTCPFCCKVRAFLNFHGISYDVVEVNPVLRQQIKWTDYRKVPIVLAKVENGYQQLNDSSMIISALTSYLEDSRQKLADVVSYYPNVAYQDDDGALKSEVMNRYFLMFNEEPKNRTKEELAEERKWRNWADNVLVHMLSPNVYRTKEEAMQAFSWFSEVGEWDRLFSSWERTLIVYVGAYAMLIIGKRLKKRHNLKSDVRQSLYDECNTWMKAIGKKQTPFMGGSSPNLADLAVYGILSSIEGCIAFKELMQNTKIGAWYWPMKKLVESHPVIIRAP